MACFATCCSAAKDPRSEPLPAIERYQSVRIRQVFAAALARDPNLGPYLDCLRVACGAAGVELVWVELPPHLAD